MGVNTAIDLHELEQELGRTKCMFDSWSSGILASAQDCKAKHLAIMKASAREMADLQQRFDLAEKCAAHVREQMSQDKEHEQALQQQADGLLAEQKALQSRLSHMQQELAAEVKKAQDLAEEAAIKRANYHQRVTKLEQVLYAYQDSLGLKLLVQNDELFLEFTQIDPEQQSRPFGFGLRVQGDDKYQVTRCEPEIAGRQQLEQQLLTERNDFAGFVRVMRQQFRQLVAADSQ